MRVRIFAASAAAAVLIAGCGGGGDSSGELPQAEGAPVEFVLTPERAMAGQSVTVSGSVKPAGREVVLQRQSGAEWAEESKVVVGDEGAFSFDIKVAKAPSVYRISAPAMRIADRSVRSRTSDEFTVEAAARGGSLEVTVPIGLTLDGKQELLPGVATFVPATKGAAVEVERKSGTGWETVAEGVQDADGRFSFLVPAATDAAGDVLRALTRAKAQDEPVYTPAVTSTYQLVWRDEFDGTELSQDWQTRPAVLSSRPCTVVVREMSVVRDGYAYLSAAQDPERPNSSDCPEGWLQNSQITTEKAQHLFKYGIFAAKIRFQKQAGVHGAFFLYYPPGVAADVPASDHAGSRGAEIDTVEFFGEANTGEGLKGAIQNSIYWNRPKADGTLELMKLGGRKDVRKLLRPGRTPADDFHVYSVEWTPKEYIFRFDGHETFRTDRGISRRPQFLYLSMLSSAFEAKYLKRSELPATMAVDWVRVWQQKK